MFVFMILALGCGASPVEGEWQGEVDLNGLTFELELGVDAEEFATGRLGYGDDWVDLSGSFSDHRNADDYEVGDDFECDEDVCAFLEVEGGEQLWFNADFSDDMDELAGEAVYDRQSDDFLGDSVWEGDVELEREG